MAAEDGGTKIIVYDYEGNQLLELGGADIGSPDRLGSITGMAETENGFVAADGNMRKIQFWAKDGTHVGAISTDDIFGVSYPWLEDMQLLDDGSLLILLTQQREDESANEKKVMAIWAGGFQIRICNRHIMKQNCSAHAQCHRGMVSMQGLGLILEFTSALAVI